MTAPLRVLLVEDSPDDEALIRRALERAGGVASLERVETRPAMIAALDGGSWDVVLSDYNLPSFSALGAIEVLKERGLTTPLIVISGGIGEDLAAAAMKAGASDYVMKGNLARLGPAIHREIREAAARREGEERFRSIFFSAPVPMIIHAEPGDILHVNEMWTKLSGYPAVELPTIAAWCELAYGAESARMLALIQSGYALEQRVHRGEFAIRTRGGELRTWEVITAPLGRFAAGRRAVITTAVDVTDRHRAEEALRRSEAQFRQAQKMEAVGRLAGGIAHDFNNLLTAISGYADLSLMRLAEGDPLGADIEEIRKAASRAAGLTRQLLAFSRKQVLAPRVLDLNSVIVATDNMLRRLIGENVELITLPAPDLSAVKADPGQIEQVLVNLAVNARDAMPGGGKLTIETRNVEIDPSLAEIQPDVTPGPCVMLAVSDTGTGMDAETRSHLFEPFFTTKPTGQGTGLGLSTIYGIVKQSGGSISCYSEVGRGTCFKVYLPRCPDAAGPAAPPEPRRNVAGGTETILVVEDEDIVRRLTVRVLEKSGYAVLEAAHGGDALLRCERHAGRIHLLVTDVVMPQMSGRELAERLGKIRPEMRVLYVSGYTAGSIVHQGVLDEGIAFLPKPFTPEALARRVREILDGPGAPP